MTQPAFYCTTCQWNGRISGAWAFGLWEKAQRFGDGI